jgi:glycosyltransferase involved in cell wall biosynthesis
LSDQAVSIILPAYNQADHIERLLNGYRVELDRLSLAYELVVVPNGCRDDTAGRCRDLAARHPRLRVVELELGGWGRAVRAGIEAATGDLLCYTNSARTSPQLLTMMLLFARAYPNVVVKAQRTIRDSWRRRAGSLLYNLECRVLFDLATWDVNGTPKVFPRSFEALLGLTRDDDLIDLEFVATCRERGYPIVEVPALVTVRQGGRSTTNYRSAWRMYRGAAAFSRSQGKSARRT